MNSLSTFARRRAPRAVASRRVQGMVARGALVAAGLVAAVAMQLAGPRLQCRLADMVGAPAAVPAVAPASMPSCGSWSDAGVPHSCKVAVATAGNAPAI